MHKKKGFTLMELILVVAISGSILTTIYGIMTTLPRVKNFNDAIQNIIQQTNDVMDRFAILFQDYTIDYEEYFNRKMVGCDETKKWVNFERNTNASGNCEVFTAYGNQNAKLIDWSIQHHISYCSSDAKEGDYSNLIHSENCKNAGQIEPSGLPTNNGGRLSYGQYQQLFRDVKNDTDNLALTTKTPNEVWDSDDRDLGEWPLAIGDPWKVQELYLISHDKNRRLYLRKNLKTYKDMNWKTSTGYTIQILKLRGFDAGEAHNFDAENDNQVYDGKIDTWACDYWQQFLCSWGPIPNYNGYQLPKDKDDGWVDLFDENLNIINWNIQISPIKNPDYAWAEEDYQINPLIQISLTSKLNNHLRANKLGGSTEWFQFSLQNVYNTKGFYIK